MKPQKLNDYIDGLSRKNRVKEFCEQWKMDRRRAHRLKNEKYCIVYEGALYQRIAIKPKDQICIK